MAVIRLKKRPFWILSNPLIELVETIYIRKNKASDSSIHSIIKAKLRDSINRSLVHFYPNYNRASSER